MNLNTNIVAELEKISEVAGYLWDKGWAECNGGNISVNLTHAVGKDLPVSSTSAAIQSMPEPFPVLAGHLLYLTGSGCRMRDIAISPLDHGVIIRIARGGAGYEIISEKAIKPTSEMPSHLAIHDLLIKAGGTYKAALHTHPTELIALTHMPQFLDAAHLTRTLWAMIPETRVIVHKGAGIVPYTLPGSTAMAKACIRQLEQFDLVLWEKHGALAVGHNIIECFDMIDALTKSAKIYLLVRNTGIEPQGISDAQLDELARAFNLKPGTCSEK